MPSRRVFLGATAGGIAALAGCTTFSAQASASIAEEIDPGTAGFLSVVTPNGDVTVAGTARDSIRLDATKTAHEDGDDLDLVDVVTEVAGDTVYVRVDKQSAEWPAVGVDVRLVVPDRLLLSLVRTGNGDVEVTNTRGSTTIHTGNGDVSLYGHRGYPTVTSGNGDVTHEAGQGVARAFTGNGAVDVHCSALTQDAVVGSGNGPLTVHVDPGLACELEVDTGRGDITHDGLDVEPTASWRGHLSGRLGSGGPATLRASTGNGDIHLLPLGNDA